MTSQLHYVVLAAALLATACGKLFQYPMTGPETSAEACHDGLDNDLDGSADCYDAECSDHCLVVTESNQEGAVAASCSDGVDNDADRRTDCADPDCASFCPETSAAACGNGADDDSDGLFDCDDTDCDGHCPEEASEACGDERDNDGDGLVDGADPRCWLLSPPQVERCATPSVDFRERFDDAYGWYAGDTRAGIYSYGTFDARWSAFGIFIDPDGSSTSSARAYSRSDEPTSPYAIGGRTDRCLTFLEGARLVSHEVFAGPWSDLELSFSTDVGIGGEVEVALVPANAALDYGVTGERSGASLAVAIDDSSSPPSLRVSVNDNVVSTPIDLPTFISCAPSHYHCASWMNIKLTFDAGVLRADLQSRWTTHTLASAPLGELELPASRLVLTGTGPGDVSRLDDVLLRIKGAPACGVRSPAIPRASCEYSQAFSALGQFVAVAPDALGALCAVVAGQRPSDLTSVTSWLSPDGGNWAPAAAETDTLDLPLRGSELTGLGLASSEGQLHLALLLRRKDDSMLLLTQAQKCGFFARLERSLTLPHDAAGASYLIRTDRHELYFTRPPTDDAGTTLWRVSGPSTGDWALEPEPLAELPRAASVAAPVSISLAGTQDLILTYPTSPGLVAPGIGLLIGSPDARRWQPLPSIPLVSSHASTFDADRPAGVALSYDGRQGLLLYGGVSGTALATGLARLWPADADRPESFSDPCGDGTCAADETCRTCAADCVCPGTVVSSDALSRGPDEWHIQTPDDYGVPYFDPNTDSLLLNDEASGWAEYALGQSIDGDFELEFELRIPSQATPSHRYPPLDSLYFGLGSLPAGVSAQPQGAFARVTIYPQSEPPAGCFSDRTRYALSLFSAIGVDVQSTLSPTAPSCPDDARLLVPFNETRRLLLARKRGKLSVTDFDGECSHTIELEQTLPLPALGSILIGAYNTYPSESAAVAEISALTLRLPDDPDDCPRETTLCSAEGAQPSCVDTNRDVQHCGSCGLPCKRGARCEAGACVCPEGRLDCADECADPDNSALNCGACGQRCDSFCLVGECDTGETCADPKLLPSGSGEYRLDLSRAAADEPPCLYGGAPTSDLIFRWTPERTGHASIRVQGQHAVINTILAVTPDPTCQPHDLFTGCNDDFTTLWGGSQLMLEVERGVPHYIKVAVSRFARAAGPCVLSIEEEP